MIDQPMTNMNNPGDPDPDNNMEQNGDPGEEVYVDDNDELVEVLDDDYMPDNLAGEMGEMDLDNDIDEDEDDGIGDMEFAGAHGEDRPQGDSKVTFKSHTKSVFFVRISPCRKYAVSGDEDDKCYVWRVDNGEMYMECKGHTDSVTCGGFSHDGKFVATADMSGLIQVWKMETKEMVWSFEVGDLEWLTWHAGDSVLLVGSADGAVWMWKIPGGATKTFQGHNAPCTVGVLMPDGVRAAVGYGDGMVKVWDLKTGAATFAFAGPDRHKEQVCALDTCKDNTVMISGSVDATSKLLNTNTGKILATLDCSTPGESDDSVEAVGFSPVASIAATGTVSGALTVWDIPTLKPRNQCSCEAGISRIKWLSNSPLFTTSTLDGVVSLWDSRTGKQEKALYGHSGMILDLDLASDSSFVATASGDKTARIFQLELPGSAT